jgi:NAD(P)H-hydrate epimerase
VILKRHKDSHKGLNGTILVVAGSKIYTGAPVFSALGAMRAGADLAILTTPKRAADIAATNPDLITVPLDGDFLKPVHVKKIQNYFDKADVMVLGPGLGEDKLTKKAILELITQFNKPIVIDADALKALKNKTSVLKGKDIILTPHRKEFEKLSGLTATEKSVHKFADAKKCVVLMKAPTDIISDGEQVKLNKTGNPGMTVGGTGDVLAGVVAGLATQNIGLCEAAAFGAKIVGTAGDLAYAEKGYGLLASDVLEKVPVAMKGAIAGKVPYIRRRRI